MELKKLAVQELYVLTELFDYNNVEQMISECTHDIQNGIIDIFVLYDKDVLIGELHVMYESDDENYAIRGRRAYLFAFRVREDFEFTVGVEDDNFRAIHMYQALGFDEILLRKQEEYQGDAYEYNLYLRR